MEGFEVSEDERWLDVLGAVPTTEEASGDELIREVRYPVDHASELHITWDATNASVRLRYSNQGNLQVETYRERVQRLLVSNDTGGRWVVVEYGHPADEGRLAVCVAPDFTWSDVSLRREG